MGIFVLGAKTEPLFKRKNMYILITLFSSVFLALRPIPWAKDDLNYLDYAMYGGELLQYTLERSVTNPLFFFVNEPLWLLINSFAGEFLQPEMVVRLVIFFSTFMVLLSMGRITNYSFFTILFFFVIVQLLKNHVTHLRQGLALGVYLTGIALNGRKGLLVRLLSPFVHTSLWFTVLVEFYEHVTSKLRLSFFIKAALFAALILAGIFFLPTIIQMTGDRRFTEYQFDMAQSSSFLGFMWWFILGTLFFIGRKRNNISDLGTYGILFYLASYFFLDFGARVFENFVPLILVSMLNSTKDFKVLFGCLMFFYGLVAWYFRGGLVF
ncbi:hypothetical protein A5N86_16395 [Geobacillus thermoleovorans]|uniref:Uncharacterized protein n=2 Tax=Geobacillus TaxID=129337 RepID=A0A2Z3N9I3_GEOTH|nr:EpsG family protein [Geobacillus thermoleovorans]AWO74553.1 hypothetical protein C1N76_08500 [Geobacillus thermoleovorans]ODA15484.1 hypothetical protein A5N86_16395 [Geobacillus thermoleovorans]